MMRFHTVFLFMMAAVLLTTIFFSAWVSLVQRSRFNSARPGRQTDTESKRRISPGVRGSSLLYENSAAQDTKENGKNANDLPLAVMARDITWSEAWPEVEINTTQPGQISPALHYVWCGKKREFKFQHYLGLLSGLRVLKPLKIYFHYTHSEPVIDKLMYNSWFKEFKEAVPVMDILHIPMQGSCGSKEMLSAILQLVAKEGGVYLGEKVVLAGLPPDIFHRSSWFAFADGEADLTQGVVYVNEGFSDVPGDNDTLLQSVISSRSRCVSVDDFNVKGHGADRKCLVMTRKPIYPRDIWAADTHFAELARWLFYGRRAAYHVQRDPSNPIPRIAHYIRLRDSKKPMYQDEFSFAHFLSVLSALYLGGFQHVYIHVDREPTGRWWQSLKTENITVLTLQRPNFVYQQKLLLITHFSDVSRYNILYRYGGAYQDFDCVWTSRVPDEMLEYPTVVSPAISRNGQWPDGLAIGMIMARPRAPFIRHAFKGYQDYHGENYLYNGIMRSYRTYEHYPDTVRFDPHFSVFCLYDRCLPRWKRNSYWALTKNGGRSYKWATQTVALHLVKPKPMPSFVSPLELNNSRNMIGDVGRWILEKSGRLSLLDQA